MWLAFCRRPRSRLPRHGTAAAKVGGRGRRTANNAAASRCRQPAGFRSKELALGLSKRAWRRIELARGFAEPLASRFARLRVGRAAHRDDQRADPRPQEWLLIEWPKGEAEPTKYWLSTLPNDIAFDRLVDLAKLRWRIERDYQELERRLDWGGSRAGAGAAFITTPPCASQPTGFLISERETTPLWTACRQVHPGGCAIRWLPTPRGSAAAARASHPQLNRNHTPPPDCRLGQECCRDALAAQHKWQDTRDRGFYDAVRLEPFTF